MNKKILLITVLLLALVVGVITYVALTRSASRPPIEQPSESSATVEAPTETPANTREGMYVDYDASKVSQTDGTILLFFHASWCPKCRALEKSIYDDGLPKGVTVYKVDYDTNQELRQRYGVTIQTTFVRIDRDGNKLASFVAYDEPTFSAVAQKLIP